MGRSCPPTRKPRPIHTGSVVAPGGTGQRKGCTTNLREWSQREEKREGARQAERIGRRGRPGEQVGRRTRQPGARKGLTNPRGEKQEECVGSEVSGGVIGRAAGLVP